MKGAFVLSVLLVASMGSAYADAMSAADQAGGNSPAPVVPVPGSSAAVQRDNIPVSAVLDSVGLAAQVTEMRESQKAWVGAWSGWISWPDHSKAASVVVVRSDLSQVEVEAFRQLVAKHSVRGRYWRGAVVSIVTRDSLQLTAWEPERVFPVLVNRKAVDDRLAMEARVIATLGNGIVRMRVSAAGTVDSVRIARTSGYGPFDRAMLDVARSARFKPGTIDKQPVPMWVELPLFVR